MPPIDDKVIALSFESQKFEQGVASTLKALDELKKSLQFQNAGKGLDEFNKAASRVSLGHIGQGIDNIADKLGFLRLTGIGVFADLASSAIRAGTQIVKSLTIDPINQGFQEYSTNLQSVQTILANTQASGATLDDVNAALLNLNKYSDQTIYNFGQMAKNIGTFTAAGVDLDTATGSIKGIANLAALSGSSAEQASSVMYQLSQAIAAGRVNLQDWNSVVNAGIGGTVFQRALAQTAVAMGSLSENSLKLVGPMKNVSIAGKSFRESIQAKPGKTSWLTSDVLTNTLRQFTGDLSAAQLKAQGFNDAQIKSIQATAKSAKLAATQVKTISQVFDVAKETAGSGWAQTFQIIFGDFGEARKTFTTLSNTINGFINANANARNKVLKDWKELGGRTVLIDSIRIAFHNLLAILKPIKEAFREFFPATTGRDLYNLTLRFNELAKALKPSPETVENLKRTFRGLFAVLDIGKQVLSGVFTLFGRLFDAAGGGDGGFLKFTAAIGDNLVALDKWLKEGGRLEDFFVKIGDILEKPLATLKAIAGAVASLFSGFSPGGVSDGLDSITSSMTPLERVVHSLTTSWNNFTDSIHGSIDIQNILENLAKAFSGVGEAIGRAASNINFDAILAVIQTGLFGALVIMFKRFLGRGTFLDQISKGFGRGIINNISGAFGSLNGSMKALQTNIKAKTLKEIAIAIALLTASVVALSFVSPEKLKTSLKAITVMLGQLIGAMALLDKLSSTGGFVKLPFIAGSLILLATAIDLLTVAVYAMSKLSWEELKKGLVGVGSLLAGISASSVVLSANSAGLIRASIGITGIAIAMNILALAVKQFGSMDLNELAKGLIGVAGGLGVIVVAMNALQSSKGMVRAGAGLILIATSLLILSQAVKQFAGMDLKELGRGLGAVGASLVIIAEAMKLMPKTLVVTAAGLVLVAVALNGIAVAIKLMGGQSIEQIAKGLGTLAGSLGILALALKAMSATKSGSVALLAAAAGIALLAPALVLLGKQPWENIVKSMAALGAAFTVLAIAGKLITSAVPGLLGFGAAMVLIGGGLALAGAGIFLISAGFSALAVAAPTGVGVLIAAFNQILKAIPEFAKNFVIGLLEIVRAFAKTAPQFVDAMVKIIESLLDAIIKSAPKFADAAIVLILEFLRVLDETKDDIIKEGIAIILSLLKGIRDNIKEIVKTAADIIVNFLKGLTQNIGRIVAAGADFLVQFLKGVASNIGKVVTAGFDVVVKFIQAIASNISRVVVAGASIMVKLIEGLGQGTLNIVAAGTKAITDFITGLGKASTKIVTAGANAMIKFIEGLSSNTIRIVNAAGQAIVDFIRGLRLAVEKYSPQIRSESFKLGVAIIDGMLGGITSKVGDLYSKVKEIAGKVIGFLKNPFGIRSPSKETHDIGVNIMQGLINGMNEKNKEFHDSIIGNAKTVIDDTKKTFGIHSPSTVMMEIGRFVGQGFAEGLRGSSDDIRNAFQDLNNKLIDAAQDARNTITTEQDKLDELMKHPKKNAEAIAAVQKVIAQNQELLNTSTAGHIFLVKQLQDEKKELISLTAQYENVSNRLDEAQKVLDDAKQKRDDAAKSFSDQFGASPDLADKATDAIKSARENIASEQDKLNKLLTEDTPNTDAITQQQQQVLAAQAQLNELIQGKVLDASGNSIDQLATYMLALTNQTKAVGTYAATLQQLRKLGLDDATYQKLLTEGTADQSFADQLLAGGKTAVQGLNKLDTQLAKVSKSLGTTAATNLYQAGVDAAQGLVNGLKAKKSDIRETMEDIAEEILRALKAKLKIKSPSEEFMEIGRFSMLGMAEGFANNTKIVAAAVTDAAGAALSAMKKSMQSLSTAVSNELNPNPVVTPVLDLSMVQSQAKDLANMTNVVPITAALSYGQASIISSQTRTAAEETASAAVGGGTTIKFEQNNHSPEALSEVEIYRQTNNLLSQAKTALGINH